MPKLRPHQPIFYVDKIMGSVRPGNTPPGTPVAELVIVSGVVHSLLNSTRGIAHTANFVFIGSQDGTPDSLVAVNVTTPSVSGSLTVTSVADTNLSTPSNVIAGSGYVYVLGSNGLTAVDISTPAAPTVAGNDASDAFAGAVSGSHLYAASPSFTGLVVYDISSPGAPAYLADVADGTFLTNPLGIAISGTHAFLTDYNTGSLVSIDISTPATPVVDDVFTDAALTEAHSVVISGSHAYVTSNSYTTGGVAAVNISNPSAMTLADSIADANMDGAAGIVIAGGALIVSGLNLGALTAIDFSTPTALVVADTLVDAQLDNAEFIASSGNYIFVPSAGGNQLTVVRYA